MNTRQQKTLECIFAVPTPTEIPWSEIVSLFGALGATVQQRAGSRIAVLLNGYVAVFHEPHPERNARRLLIRDVKDFLQRAGITP